MDLFISNLDSRTTKEQLKHILTPILQRFKIEVFELRKRNDKTFAFLAIADISKAQTLLAHAAQDVAFLKSPSGKHARFGVSTRHTDPQLFRVLQKEEKDLKSRQAWQNMTKQNLNNVSVTEDSQSLGLVAIECGRWGTTADTPIFMPCYKATCGGSLKRDGRTLLVKMKVGPNLTQDMVIDLFNIQALCLAKVDAQDTLTITSTLAPRFFEEELSDAEDMFADMVESLSAGLPYKKPTARYRISGFFGTSPEMVGSCLSYRLTFQPHIAGLRNAVQKMVSFRVLLMNPPAAAMRGKFVTNASQMTQLEATISRHACSFGWKFQIEALWANGLLSPGELRLMMPAMSELRERAGEATLIRVLQRMAVQLPIADASTKTWSSGFRGALAAMRQQEEYLLGIDFEEESPRDGMFIHKVTVTPTGLYPSGPEEVAANRILRQYRAHQDCFLRVLFADENEEKLEFDRDFSNDKILKGRFLDVLRKGLRVAGEHYSFLGFSHSSLRSQTCWFMRPFVHQGSLLFAQKLISQLGDFSTIRCPAKCAARIGQAFSETTSAVRVNPKIVVTIPDVQVGRYVFTDGCGTIPKDTWRAIRGNSTLKNQPTSYQIRYKGAKGMLSLDTRLPGQQIRLRQSMVKFTGSPSNEIEICGTNSRPLPFKLNRPVIKILEDLGVPATVFETLQEQAIHKLRLSARSTKSAIDFLSLSLSDTNSGLPALLRCIQKIRIDVTEDSFLREVLGALLQEQLRQIKYRGRILVPNALTLYGISDETGFLDMGEVFVTFDSEDSKRRLYLTDRVAITRSPALHPGDVQTAEAKIPPQGSSLWNLRNCVVFSQKGFRDLPSMLSGGDLDGDLYNVIYDEDLIPKSTEYPAAYLPAQPVDIGRTVTSDDMTEFFVDFMQNDQLGRIATLHQVFADLHGTKSPTCLLLAELHSTAVDFSKSGVPVDVKKIPKAPPYRPDFMAPTASTKVEKGIQRPAEMEAPEGNQRYRYYESDRVLGKLYRAVDEDVFFRELEDDSSSFFSKEASNTALEEILEWVEEQVDATIVNDYSETAIEARNYYETTMVDIMSQYTVHRSDPLTEKEVFTGIILGRSGAGSRYQREQSDYMRSRFNWELRDLKSWMQRQADGDEDEFICLAAACLHHAVKYKSCIDEKLSSFAWVVAAMCVPALLEQQKEQDLPRVFHLGPVHLVDRSKHGQLRN